MADLVPGSDVFFDETEQKVVALIYAISDGFEGTAEQFANEINKRGLTSLVKNTLDKMVSNGLAKKNGDKYQTPEY